MCELSSWVHLTRCWPVDGAPVEHLRQARAVLGQPGVDQCGPHVGVPGDQPDPQALRHSRLGHRPFPAQHLVQRVRVGHEALVELDQLVGMICLIGGGTVHRRDSCLGAHQRADQRHTHGTAKRPPRRDHWAPPARAPRLDPALPTAPGSPPWYHA